MRCKEYNSKDISFLRSEGIYGCDASKLVHSPVMKYFWLTKIKKIETRYGVGRLIYFIDERGEKEKAWLPNSCYKTICEHAEGYFKLADETKDKTVTSYFLRKRTRLYFRIVEMKEYKGHRYPSIECKVIEM